MVYSLQSTLLNKAIITISLNSYTCEGQARIIGSRKIDTGF